MRKHNVIKMLLGTALPALLAAFAVSSCEKGVPEVSGGTGAGEPPVRLEFSLASEGTRLTGVSVVDERRVNRWVLYVFDQDGNRVGDPFLVNNGSDPVEVYVTPGTYDFWAVVNYPVSGAGVFSPASVNTKSALMAVPSYLQDNASGSLVMSGGKGISVTAGDDGRQFSITVYRLAVKVGFSRVSVSMSSSYWAGVPFTLKRVFLTNVYTESRIGSDLASQSMSGSRNHWYNTLGYHTSGSGYYNGSSWVQGTSSSIDGLTSDTGINVGISNNGVLNQEHVFYCYPNAVTDASDSRSAVWSSGRRTRMVLEADLGGTTYYYTVTIPTSSRNNMYMGDVTIRRPGSLDPEVDDSGSVEVKWTTSTEDWSSVVVNEQS